LEICPLWRFAYAAGAREAWRCPRGVDCASARWRNRHTQRIKIRAREGMWFESTPGIAVSSTRERRGLIVDSVRAVSGREQIRRIGGELREVFERALVRVASLTRAGSPVTVPATPTRRREDHRRVDRADVPAKAERARRNAKVALLFADELGAGTSNAPVVLVQGRARCATRTCRRTLTATCACDGEAPASVEGQPKALLRRLTFYYARIWIEITPVRIRCRTTASSRGSRGVAGRADIRVPSPTRSPRTAAAGVAERADGLARAGGASVEHAAVRRPDGGRWGGVSGVRSRGAGTLEARRCRCGSARMPRAAAGRRADGAWPRERSRRRRTTLVGSLRTGRAASVRVERALATGA